MGRKRIIIDTDVGIDDALEILLALASPELELRALTASSENCGASQGLINILSILQMAEAVEIAVAPGVLVPLVQPLLLAPETHGETGMGYARLPEVRYQSSHKLAVDLIIEEVLAFPGEISLVNIGPLTNLAMAIRRESRIVEFLNEVIIMGGALLHAGNTTPQAEFNIYCDPDAAQIVF